MFQDTQVIEASIKNFKKVISEFKKITIIAMIQATYLGTVAGTD